MNRNIRNKIGLCPSMSYVGFWLGKESGTPQAMFTRPFNANTVGHSTNPRDTQWEREALKHICFSWILRFGKPRFPRDQDAVARWEVCSSRRWADPPARVLRTLALLDTAGFIGASDVSDLVCCTIPLPHIAFLCHINLHYVAQGNAAGRRHNFPTLRDCTRLHIISYP